MNNRQIIAALAYVLDDVGRKNDRAGAFEQAARAKARMIEAIANFLM